MSTAGWTGAKPGGRTHKEKIPGSKLHKEKSDAAEGQANKTLGKDGKLSWWSGG